VIPYGMRLSCSGVASISLRTAISVWFTLRLLYSGSYCQIRICLTVIQNLLVIQQLAGMQIKQVGVQLYLRTLTTRQCPQSPASRSCSNRSLYPACRAHSSKPAAAGLLLCAHAGTDTRTDTVPFRRPYSAYHVGSKKG